MLFAVLIYRFYRSELAHGDCEANVKYHALWESAAGYRAPSFPHFRSGPRPPHVAYLTQF